MDFYEVLNRKKVRMCLLKVSDNELAKDLYPFQKGESRYWTINRQVSHAGLEFPGLFDRFQVFELLFGKHF
jgi:hypothetical protein